MASGFSLRKHISDLSIRWQQTLMMMKEGWSRKPSVNCWFCNEDFCIGSRTENTGWSCPSCQQYNGFDEDGNYDRPIPEQFKMSKDDKMYCQRGNFNVRESVLCRLCHQNQALKVGQLASFVPLAECHYDGEVEAYDQYLESVYRLCQCCRDRVSCYLTRQDEDILKKLDEENLQITETRLYESALNDTKSTLGKGSFQPLIVHSFFILCLLMAVFNTLIYGKVCLELERRRTSLIFPSSIYTAVYYMTSTIPFNGLSKLPVYFGTGFCLLGLLSVGKNRVYIVDALHILHWLALLIMDIISPSSSLSTPTAIICFIMYLSTTSVCFLCLTMSRHSRKTPQIASQVFGPSSSNTTQTASKGENLPRTNDKLVQSVSPVLSTPPSSPLLYPVGEAKNFFKPISSRESSPTSFASSSPISLFSPEKTKSTYEIVRDGLESFSLGLAKKSGSTSSIWSLPSALSSYSTTSPDSTLPDTISATDKHNISQSVSRNILSPSRLSFVSFSHTPFGKFSSSPDPDSGSSPESSQHRHSHSHSSNISSSKSDQSSPKSAEEKIPCSQSLHSQQKQSFVKYRSESKCFPVRPHHLDDQLKSSLKRKNEIVAPDSTSNENVRQVRRSNRIAMRGKIIKPWPLKKSLSVNNMYDRPNVDFFKKGSDNDSSVAHRGKLQMASPGSSPVKNTPYVAQKNHYFMDNIAEMSDDEDMDYSLKDRRNHRRVMRGEIEKDSKWTWTLLGMVIGISFTVNFFLGLNIWMNKNS